MPAQRKYAAPSFFEKSFNRFLGIIAGAGFGPSYVYRLRVKGRKSGKLYSTPVSIVEINGKKFLVAPRGRTQWVRNAEASGEIALVRGWFNQRFRLRSLQENEKPEVLKKYLASYKTAVQRFFPIQPDSTLQSFSEIASGYPVFELVGA